MLDQDKGATSSLSAYEKGKSQPTLETLLKLSDFYQVTLDYLVRGVEKEIPLSQAEIKTNHTDRIGFRLENRIGRLGYVTGYGVSLMFAWLTSTWLD